jgi:hypothetical protein
MSIASQQRCSAGKSAFLLRAPAAAGDQDHEDADDDEQLDSGKGAAPL